MSAVIQIQNSKKLKDQTQKPSRVQTNSKVNNQKATFILFI